MMPRRFYISGPMSGYPDFNSAVFHAAAVGLRGRGFDIASPHEVEPAPRAESEAAWLAYMRADLALLAQCDALILLKGWPQSKGARIELATALGLELPIFYLDGETLIDFNKADERPNPVPPFPLCKGPIPRR